MPPTGPNTEPADPVDLLTSWTSAVQTVSSGDILMSTLFAAGVAHRIYPTKSGNLAVKRINDANFVVYPVFAGQPIDGKWLAVGGTGNGSDSGITFIAEI